MKVLLIYPRISQQIFSEHHFLQKLMSFGSATPKISPLLMMPAALPTVAALTPPDIEVRLLDENVEEIDFDEPADIVGLSYFSVMANEAYRIADRFRARGTHVVMGGVHTTVAPEEASQHADTVVIGEAEQLWPQFLEDFRAGKPKPVYRCTEKPEMSELVIPAWDRMKHRHYMSYLVQTARGCAYDCDFCSIASTFGKPRFKPIEHVIKEIEELQKRVKQPWKLYISFADDNIVSSPKRAKALFRALIPLEIRWWAQASINMAKDEELLSLAQQSGCDSLLIGFESVSQSAQAEVNKSRVNKVDGFKDAIAKLQRYGISLYPSFIFGFDTDDTSVFQETRDFIQETGMEFPMLNTLTPFVGTRLHDRMRAEGRLRECEWKEFNSYEVCYTPRNMTAEQLLVGHRSVIFDLYSMDAIFERVETAYKKGALKSTETGFVLRLFFSLLLVKEIFSLDKGIRRFIRRCLRYVWTRWDMKVEILLFLMDRFIFARKLKRSFLADGNRETLKALPAPASATDI